MRTEPQESRFRQINMCWREYTTSLIFSAWERTVLTRKVVLYIMINEAQFPLPKKILATVAEKKNKKNKLEVYV